MPKTKKKKEKIKKSTVKKTKSTVKKTKKTREKFQIRKARIYVQSSFNNTLITLTDENGEVLSWASAGTLGFKGTKKSTPYAASLVAKTMIERAKNFGIDTLRIFVKGVGSGRDSAVRAFQGANFDVTSIADITPIPHNGCRARKPRRV